MVYKLINKIKHYEWGSDYWIPEFLNFDNSVLRDPCAEMWMGTHAGAPSRVMLNDKNINLSRISGELTFLLKLIAVDKPLSIQAHPDKERAKEGFAREELQGISIDNPARNYKDPNHKPEILCALSPFTLMAGFQEPDKICKSFEELLIAAPALKNIVNKLLITLKDSVNGFFTTLFEFSEYEKECLCAVINEIKADKAGNVISTEQWELMKKFVALYPLDTAVLSPLFLNIISLQPYQAVFIPDGILHAYISGFGLELMANSDNVLRGGLTNKHVDINELNKILKYNPFVPEIILPVNNEKVFEYPVPCDDFYLANIRSNSDNNTFTGNGPAICIITEGELKTGGLKFCKGDSFFIPRDNEKLILDGNFSFFMASMCKT